MASIRRKPSGNWEARYRNADGRLHARTFATKTEARRWATDMETDVRRGEWVDPRLGRVTFTEWTEEYLSTIVHLREATRYLYERTLNKHVLPAFGSRPVVSIEQVDIRRFVAQKLAEGLSPASVRHMRQALRQVLNCAKGSGAIRSNPCDGVRLPMPSKAEPVFLSAEEAGRLAKSTRPPYDLLVRFAVATGLRPSELCGLRVGRLNLLAGTVEVARRSRSCEASSSLALPRPTLAGPLVSVPWSGGI